MVAFCGRSQHTVKQKGKPIKEGYRYGVWAHIEAITTTGYCIALWTAQRTVGASVLSVFLVLVEDD